MVEEMYVFKHWIDPIYSQYLHQATDRFVFHGLHEYLLTLVELPFPYNMDSFGSAPQWDQVSGIVFCRVFFSVISTFCIEEIKQC